MDLPLVGRRPELEPEALLELTSEFAFVRTHLSNSKVKFYFLVANDLLETKLAEEASLTELSKKFLRATAHLQANKQASC